MAQKPLGGSGAASNHPFIFRHGRQNYLLTKLLKLDVFNITMSLISINNSNLREHSIKILQLLIQASQDFHDLFKSKNGYQILSRIIRDDCSISNLNLCQTVLNSILRIYDNPNDLRPMGHTLVQQVMNKSLIAKEIVKTVNDALRQPKKCILFYYDFFELLFEFIVRLD